MKNKTLTGLQIFLVIIWAIASYAFDNGFNPLVFNFLPIPNFWLVVVTITLISIGYWLQGLKTKK